MRAPKTLASSSSWTPRSGKPCGSSIRLARRSFGRQLAAACSARAEAPSSSSKASSLSLVSSLSTSSSRTSRRVLTPFSGARRMASGWRARRFTHVIPATRNRAAGRSVKNAPKRADPGRHRVERRHDHDRRQPLEIDRYEVIVENDESNFDVHMAPGPTRRSRCRASSWRPGPEYIFEVLAIEAGGKPDHHGGCFVTAE